MEESRRGNGIIRGGCQVRKSKVLDNRRKKWQSPQVDSMKLRKFLCRGLKKGYKSFPLICIDFVEVEKGFCYWIDPFEFTWTLLKCLYYPFCTHLCNSLNLPARAKASKHCLSMSQAHLNPFHPFQKKCSSIINAFSYYHTQWTMCRFFLCVFI